MDEWSKPMPKTQPTVQDVTIILERLVAAIEPLNIKGTPITKLDTRLNTAFDKAKYFLNRRN